MRNRVVKSKTKKDKLIGSTVSRKQVVEELPEINKIRNSELREKVIDAWVLALEQSSFTSIRQIAPAGNPGVLEAKKGDQTDHIRGVTRMAMQIADQMAEQYPDLEIDRDIVIAGGNPRRGLLIT
jgi:23S rRNA maturation-related 3'-5' exoribonuclease YhaM